MLFLHTKNPAEFHDWFAWYPVTVLRRTPAGPQFYTVWLTKVRRKMVIVQGLMHWVYELKTTEEKPTQAAPVSQVETTPAKPNRDFRATDLLSCNDHCTYEQLIERMSERGCVIEQITVDELRSMAWCITQGLLFISRDVLEALALSDKEMASFVRDLPSSFYFTWRGYRVYTEPSAENLILRFKL